MTYAIVKSLFNREVVDGLLEGATDVLREHRLKWETFDAPGAFEIPLIAQRLAKSGRFEGVICLGAVIKGETAHFEAISAAAAYGIMQAGLNSGIPVTFGILTTYTEEQAQARSRRDAHNKGREAAEAAFFAARTLRETGILL